MKRFTEKIWSLGGTFLLSSIVLSSVTSCGSSIPNAKTLEVKDVFVPGIASNYIEVTDGSYELQYSNDGETERILLPVTFKLKEEIGLIDPGMGYLRLNMLDASGVTFGAPEFRPNNDKVDAFLGGEVGTEVTLNFTVTDNIFGLEEGDASKIMDKTVNFELSGTDISGKDPNGTFTTSKWDGEFGELDEDTELNSGSFDDVSDIMDNAKDFTDQAMETAKEMQEEAMKQAKEMQKEAMEQAKDMYKF